MPPAKYVYLLLFACVACAPPASAQYDVEEEDRVWIRALLDLRLAEGGSAPSWTDHGPGKTRYGGRSTGTGFERVTRVTLAQLAIEAGATLPSDIRAEIQVNVQPDIAEGHTPWLVEALLRKEWGGHENGFGLQAGVMNIPFSLEHIGSAWSPEFTLSASALNSWLWEEFSLAGVEAEWWHDTEHGLRLGALAGAGFGPDTFGRVLALRGFTMGDGLGGLNGDLALPNGTRTDIFDERDDRPAAYTWLTLGDVAERATFRIGYLDNLGDQSEPGVWHTRIGTAGVTLRPHPRIDVVVQYLDGKARVREPANDSDLRAFYAMISHRYKQHRLSVRYDEFRIDDIDGGNPTSEEGDGVTAAWFYQWGLRHQVGLEHTWLDSRRPRGAADELSSDGWQLSYRFRY
ncbi:MAG: hypothetical protein ACREVI_15035 [Steroidobacteraceae bacterium]